MLTNTNETRVISPTDLVLIFLGLEPEKPVHDKRKLINALYAFSRELVSRGYKVLVDDFLVTRYGAKSKTLEKAIDDLVTYGFIERGVKPAEDFKLTDKGKTEAFLIIEEKIDEKDLSDLTMFRYSIDQFTRQGIARYVKLLFSSGLD
jgi:hypothetical protein